MEPNIEWWKGGSLLRQRGQVFEDKWVLSLVCLLEFSEVQTTYKVVRVWSTQWRLIKDKHPLMYVWLQGGRTDGPAPCWQGV